MKIFLELPFILSITILTSVSIAIFYLLQKFFKGKYTHEILKENHEIGGFIYNAVGIIYAVLIAFVVFAIWTSQNDTDTKIEQEASNLLDLYYDASIYPDSLKLEIQSTIREYVKRVTKEEWEAMGEGKRDSLTTRIFIKLNRIYLSIDPDKITNRDVLAEQIKKISEIREFRRHRVISSKRSMPDILWFVLLTGSIILIVFTFFFSTRNSRHQFIMTSFLVFACVLVLYLVYVFDHPFIGRYSIKPEAFQPLIDIINRHGK
ncbi:MAG: DUF4239 domain-containing protein [Ignavibacteriae bacterium]|nr:DUF4239 domain-containing protein [Ignavibacteriota bacterium]